MYHIGSVTLNHLATAAPELTRVCNRVSYIINRRST